MSHHPRQVLSPGASRKRKEREAFYSVKPLKQTVNISVTTTTSSKAAEPVSSNRLLAGYMAYEFLTKGTLLGQKFDPARAGAVPVVATELRRHKQVQSQSSEAEPSGRVKPGPSQTYAEVANLMKSDGDGVHIPGIVNPTQLARWIQM
ncbi:unnamed protein product [Ilex paraguariensis]|uniref:Embryo sac development arrest 6 n=1 Tax=Ilex paraguariensis TaxID=185542 RepID=A0ABC8TBL6_9AQUA